MRKVADICYGNEQCLDIYLPESKTFPLFIYFHGGGLNSGDKSEADVLAAYLTERNIAVVSADYRLYPKARFPQFIEDAAAAVKWSFAHMEEYGTCKGVYVGGSSAGAYLSMMLCFAENYLAAQGIRTGQISGFIHNAGQPTAHFQVLAQKGFDSRRMIVDETAPLFFVGLRQEYPPMLFLVADKDLPNRYEQTMLMISAMKSFGCEEDKIQFKALHGEHCQYVRESDALGDSILGKIICGFILGNACLP